MLEKMGAFFDARLAGYEEHQLSCIDSAREFYPFTAACLPQEPGTRLLDLGCGTGLELDFYFARVPTAEVTGIDLAPGMLEALRRKFPGKALRLHLGSYFDLPLGEKAYDAAVSVESLHHFTKAEKTPLYRKLRKALRPGGCFILTDYFAASDEEERSRRAELLRLKAEQNLPDDAFYHYDTPLTVAHETEALLEAGFASVEVMKSWGPTSTLKAIAPKTDPERSCERITVFDDGIPLVGLLERPAAEPGPLVIVLHGFTSSKDRTHTAAACEAMREAGFSTLRFDLYGHGESGGEFQKHTLDKWISNTLAVMDWAEGQEFVTELWLSGHSQGGLTAALAAGREAGRVRGLILRAPAFMIPRGAREGRLLGEDFDPVRLPERFRTIKGLTLEGDYLRSAQSIRVEEAIDAFPGPVLLLHGEVDDVVPLEEVLAASRRYRSCTLKLIPGETHHFDRSPALMKSVIRDWLNQEKEVQRA